LPPDRPLQLPLARLRRTPQTPIYTTAFLPPITLSASASVVAAASLLCQLPSTGHTSLSSRAPVAVNHCHLRQSLSHYAANCFHLSSIKVFFLIGECLKPNKCCGWLKRRGSVHTMTDRTNACSSALPCSSMSVCGHASPLTHHANMTSYAGANRMPYWRLCYRPISPISYANESPATLSPPARVRANPPHHTILQSSNGHALVSMPAELSIWQRATCTAASGRTGRQPYDALCPCGCGGAVPVML